MLDTINVLIVGHDNIPNTITSFSDKELAEELFRKLCGDEFIEEFLDDGVGDMENGSTVYLIWSSLPIIN